MGKVPVVKTLLLKLKSADLNLLFISPPSCAICDIESSRSRAAFRLPSSYTDIGMHIILFLTSGKRGYICKSEADLPLR